MIRERERERENLEPPINRKDESAGLFTLWCGPSFPALLRRIMGTMGWNVVT